MFSLKLGPRLPSLDGMRAISILLVVTFHLFGENLGRFAIIGNLGVRIFFVISGYLITHLLLKELTSTGGIDLKRFYKRRALRIFPAFYTFLLAMVMAWALGWIPARATDYIRGATYVINYFPGATQTVYVRHLWSLAVEEQFYLIWPATLMLLGRKWGIAAAGSILIVSPLCRVVYYLFIPSIEPVINSRFETVADALATGCVLAAVLGTLSTHEVLRRLLYSKAFLLVPALLLAVAVLGSAHPRFYYGAGITVINVGIALCIARWVTQSSDVAGKLLNLPPLRVLGVLSYSVYLWQQPFFMENGASRLQHLPWSVVCVVLFSCCSFFLIEQPMMKKKLSQSLKVLPENQEQSRHPYRPEEGEPVSPHSGAA